jgi:hypothetical protein
MQTRTVVIMTCGAETLLHRKRSQERTHIEDVCVEEQLAHLHANKVRGW